MTTPAPADPRTSVVPAGPATPCRPGCCGWSAAGRGSPRRAAADRSVPVPAQFHDDRRPSPATAGTGPARPTWRSRERPGHIRPAPTTARRTARRMPRDRRPRDSSTSTSCTRAPGILATIAATQQPTMPAPTTAIRSPTSGAASHSAFTAVSTVPARTARAAGTSGGHYSDGFHRYDISGLMWVKTEDSPSEQIVRARLDHPDIEVPVLDRPGKVPVLERRPHRRVQRWRHRSGEHERLRAAAYSRVQRADQHLVRPGRRQRDRADLAVARPAHPEGAGVERHASTESNFDDNPTDQPRPTPDQRSRVHFRRAAATLRGGSIIHFEHPRQRRTKDPDNPLIGLEER